MTRRYQWRNTYIWYSGMLEGLAANENDKAAKPAPIFEWSRYRELVYTKQRFITPEHLRAAIREVANATFRARFPHIWGEATTACASDSKKFAAVYLESMVMSQVSQSGPFILTLGQ